MRDFIEMVSGFRQNSHNYLLQEMARQQVRCGFFFAGTDSAEGKDLAGQLCSAGVDISAIYVLDTAIWQDIAMDIPVLDLTAIEGNPLQLGEIVMRVTGWHTAFYEYFRRQGIPSMVLMDTTVAETIENMVNEHLPELYDTYSLLKDEESRRVFRHTLTACISGRVSDYRFAPEAQYFLEGFTPEKGSIAIDGGAFDGGTASDFSAMGADVYAFEMDKANYQQCLDLAAKYGFMIENMGLGDCEREEHYQSAGVGSRRNCQGTETARFIDLDTYTLKMGLPRIDYIKLDVEGAELSVLKGAARSIGKWKPKLAISAYHNFEDMWTLAAYIHSIRPDYELAFRHYRIDVHNYWLGAQEKNMLRKYGLDYFIPGSFETVLYCR